MIKVHPTDAMLHAYVAGDLNSASGLVVSAHLDMCPHCRRMIKEIENELSQEFEEPDASNASSIEDADMQLMMDAIFSSAAPANSPSDSMYDDSDVLTATATKTDTSNRAEHHDPSDNMIYLEGKRFRLPRTLAKQKHRIGPWNKMMGNMWRATINLGTDEVANLIYMDRATSVPEHTHKGTELQLVINGSFSDEYGRYNDGDMLLLDHTHQHTPQTRDEDCLILAVMDGPLHFTSGISRLLNPFSSLFFR